MDSCCLVALFALLLVVVAAAAVTQPSAVAVDSQVTLGAAVVAAVTAEAEPWWACSLHLLRPELSSSLADLPGSH